jgi:Ca2+-transporting ATPase
MLRDNNLVRVLSSCETMGGATTICSDKTGTLTQNKMTVVQGSFFGGATEFDTHEQIIHRMLDSNESSLRILTQSINLNSTAYEGLDEDGKKILVGSKTECALLEFTSLLRSAFPLDRAASKIVSLMPFSSERKRMSTMISKADSKSQEISFDLKLTTTIESKEYKDGECAPPLVGDARLFVKGASELVLASCEYYVTESGEVEALTDAKRKFFEKRILSYASNALRTIGMAFKDVTGTDSPRSGLDMDNLIWLGMCGIEDPLRPEVPPAVEKCQNAGIIVRMVTGDNAVTAENIAKRCGILNRGGVVMEGPNFRVLSDAEMRKVIPKLRVLARSSPLDKRILVNKLKEMGETVAVTGDGSNDGPALKAADVGFAMGIAGTEVAKEASDIILMDDNFASLVKAVMWGRSVYDAVRKFLQFQLTVNITAVGLAMITAVTSTDNKPVITAVQLLWVNLIMDTLAALALATDPPTEALLDRKPHKKSDPLINYDMWKMMLCQGFFQIAMCTILTYLSPQIFGFDFESVKRNPSKFYIDVNESRPLDLMINEVINYRRSAVVFNAFVYLTQFNLFNGRMIYGERNVFAGVTKNKLFMAIIAMIAISQFFIIQFGWYVFHVQPLSAIEWVVTLGVGVSSLLTGWIVKAILPDVGREWFKNRFYEQDLELSRVQWDEAIRKVQLQVSVITAFKSYRREKSGVVVLE